ncbi:MAG: GH92 family glycosyl hydrolase [Paludibacter sp.]
MFKTVTVIFLLTLPFQFSNAEGRVDLVNTLQGTNSTFELSRGNTYPTLAMPWGMNFWTPQTGENRNGWIYQYKAQTIRGFRQTHQCSPWTNDYAAFSLMPVSGVLQVNQSKRALPFSHSNEVAKPHYYKVQFDNKLITEMSPTERGVFLRFTFPEDQNSYVIIDANSGGSMVKIIPEQHKIIGYCKNANHSVSKDFTNYFVIVFDQDFVTSGTWKNNSGNLSPNNLQDSGDYVGAYISFKKGIVVNAKVSSSFISFEQAERNYQQELAGATSFEQIKNKAEIAWNKQLDKIEVEGGTDEEVATFYSCYFRSMLFPRKFFEFDADNNPVYYSPYDYKVHSGYMYTDDGFWDTFRSQFPLNIILHPKMHGRYMQTLLDAYDQSGWLPSWSFPGHSGGMIGNHAFSLIADAYVKGIRTFDPKHALLAMRHDATNKGPRGPSIGRDAVIDYQELGYVPTPNYGEATAKTLEYCYDDFCAMQVAKLSNSKDDEAFFSKTIFNYKNVYDAGTKFMRGRKKDGSWMPDFDPKAWGGAFIEGSAWHYHWSVFHDVQGLINLMGGDHQFTAKLDSVFTEPNTFKVGTYGHVIHEMTEMAMINMGQYAHGNQPIQHMPYLYTYAGEPWKTQYWARTIMNKLYNSGPDGFCGDEDQGQTSSWYVISAMGLYSVCPGTDQYVIGSPVFPLMKIHLENGKTITIEAKNNSIEKPYIKSALLNGKKYTRNWISYSDLMNGATIQYEMSNKPNTKRGIKKEDRPYSVSK